MEKRRQALESGLRLFMWALFLVRVGAYDPKGQFSKDPHC